MFLKVSAPARVCLFGEHQDYLKLNVISCAINLRTFVSGRTLKGDKININALDLDKKDSFYVSKEVNYNSGGLDYLRAVVNVIKKDGYDLGGLDCKIKSYVPMNSGLSSSAALLVSWTKFLTEMFNLPYNEKDIAITAYRAEHNELGIPCGVMDQFSSSLGGILHIKCLEKPLIEKIDTKLSGLVIGDTLVKKLTKNVHKIKVNEIKDAIGILSKHFVIDIQKAKYEEIETTLKKLPELQMKRLIGTVLIRDLTNKAKTELKRKIINHENLGELLNLHQKYLRDYIEVSTPEIEEIIRIAINAGAKGGKLTGAGMGGCVILYAPGRQKEVARAIENAGYKAYIVKVDNGARIEK